MLSFRIVSFSECHIVCVYDNCISGHATFIWLLYHCIVAMLCYHNS